MKKLVKLKRSNISHSGKKYCFYARSVRHSIAEFHMFHPLTPRCCFHGLRLFFFGALSPCFVLLHNLPRIHGVSNCGNLDDPLIPTLGYCQSSRWHGHISSACLRESPRVLSIQSPLATSSSVLCSPSSWPVCSIWHLNCANQPPVGSAS